MILSARTQPYVWWVSLHVHFHAFTCVETFFSLFQCIDFRWILFHIFRVLTVFSRFLLGHAWLDTVSMKSSFPLTLVQYVSVNWCFLLEHIWSKFHQVCFTKVQFFSFEPDSNIRHARRPWRCIFCIGIKGSRHYIMIYSLLVGVQAQYNIYLSTRSADESCYKFLYIFYFFTIFYFYFV